MDTLDIPHGAVVVGVDGSNHADKAIDWAARHAANESRPLVLLHAVDGTWATVSGLAQGGIDPTPYLDQADLAGQALLDTALARVGPARSAGSVVTRVVRSDPRAALLTASKTASMVVVGSRGHGPIRSLLLGSVGVAVIGHAACPVVVVRPHHAGLVRRGVLVGSDGTAGSPTVLEFAYRQAAELDLPLTIVHTHWDAIAIGMEAQEIEPADIDYPAAALVLSETLAGLGEKFPEVKVQKKIVRGTPTAGLMAMADTMDLVVVGHHRQDPVSRAMFGSVALGVVEHAATVVAVIPEV